MLIFAFVRTYRRPSDMARCLATLAAQKGLPYRTVLAVRSDEEEKLGVIAVDHFPVQRFDPDKRNHLDLVTTADRTYKLVIAQESCLAQARAIGYRPFSRVGVACNFDFALKYCTALRIQMSSDYLLPGRFRLRFLRHCALTFSDLIAGSPGACFILSTLEWCRSFAKPRGISG